MCLGFIAGSTWKARFALVANVGPSILRWPSCGHISKTEQDRSIYTMEYTQIGTADSVADSYPPQMPPLLRGDSVSAGRWL